MNNRIWFWVGPVGKHTSMSWPPQSKGSRLWYLKSEKDNKNTPKIITLFNLIWIDNTNKIEIPNADPFFTGWLPLYKYVHYDGINNLQRFVDDNN